MRKNKPSRTAYKVALNIITLGSKPGMDKVFPSCIVEATAQLLLTSGLVNATVLRWCRTSQMVSVYEAFNWMMPGQFEAFAHRKAFFERQIKQAINKGATQVLNLGAGYDTIGWCLAANYPDVAFFEIDHPNTAHLKAKAVKEMGVRGNLHLIAADLNEQRLTDILTAHKAWYLTAQTAVQAEGLLMYLPAATVKDLFKQCAAVSAAGSQIAFSFVATREDGLPDAGPWTKFILWSLRVNGEPWLWSIPPEHLPAFLEATGWTISPGLEQAPQKHGVEFFSAAMK